LGGKAHRALNPERTAHTRLCGRAPYPVEVRNSRIPHAIGIHKFALRVMMLQRKTVPMPQKFHLTLLIHAHQPCGNFEHVLEKAYDTSYLPFIEHLEKHPGVRLGLHYSGPLLTWIEKHRPEYFVRLKNLAQSG
jgi:hypothetical protein